MTAHRIEHARAEDFLRSLPDASVDAVVTDPPYGLSATTPAKVEACLRAWLSGDDYEHGAKGFMGREWDGWVPGPALWRDVLRVLKPGGHALVFAGSRTVDLMGLSLRLAGFEIRDTMQWLYGSGFPKSLDVSKALDRVAGIKRGTKPDLRNGPNTNGGTKGDKYSLGFSGQGDIDVGPATDAARAWDGWGTALKPAHEPVIVARKPPVGTVAANVVEHGTGALNIGGCRVTARDAPAEAEFSQAARSRFVGVLNGGNTSACEPRATSTTSAGRWPPNVVLIHPDGCEGDHNGAGCVDGCPVGELARGGGGRSITGVRSPASALAAVSGTAWGVDDHRSVEYPGEHGGTAARFFPSFHYCAKAARSEREAGLAAPEGARANRHPTVKPIDAMRWLCRLVTRPGGLILDPFAGSGTTGCAAALEGFHFVGCEMDEAHAALAAARIAHWAPASEHAAPDCDVPQLDLFGVAS